jgi:RNA polymerase sigma factor (sigma-70 family)
MTIGEAIIQLRKEEGINNKGLALLLGISYASVSIYEKGKRIPPMHRLVQIATVFKRNLIITIVSNNVQAQFIMKESIRSLSFDKRLAECEGALRGYCWKHLCHTQDDVNDLVQDTMYTALRRYDTLRDDVAMITWLIGIAKNTVRKKASKLVYVESYIEHDRITDDIEEYFRGHADVFRFIEKLTPKRREAYKLSLIGLEYKEIAVKLNTTEGCIKSIMQQNKIRLRQMIENTSPCNLQ